MLICCARSQEARMNSFSNFLKSDPTSSIISSLHLTLPFELVKSWINLSKQQWITNVANPWNASESGSILSTLLQRTNFAASQSQNIIANDKAPEYISFETNGASKSFPLNSTTTAGNALIAGNEITSLSDPSQKLPWTELMPSCLETDFTVITDQESGQSKVHLLLHLTKVGLLVKEGALHVILLDVNKVTSSSTCSPSQADFAKTEINVVITKHDSHIGPEMVCHEGLVSKENNYCRNLETVNRDELTSENPAFIKRKRGRPRKICSNAKTLPIAHNISNHSTGSAAAAAETAATSVATPLLGKSRYCLRGVKLPASIFGYSDSELDEDDDDLPSDNRKHEIRDTHHAKQNSSQLCEHASASNHLNFQQNCLHKFKQEELEILQPIVVDNQEGIRTAQPLTVDNPAIHGILQPAAIDAEQTLGTKPLSVHMIAYSNRKMKELERKVCRPGMPLGRRKRIKVDLTGQPKFARRKRNNQKLASCKYCRHMFCDYSGVSMHVKKFHTSEKDLDEYLQRLKKLEVVQCSVCGVECESRIHRQQHEDKEHFKMVTLQCQICSKSFINLPRLRSHIRSVHCIQGKAHACPHCPAKFKWAATLKAHIGEIHDGIKTVSCDICGKKFYRRAQLNRHARIHGPDDAKIPCKLCGRKFWYANNLQRHVSIIHGPQQESWHCSYCGKGFHRKEGLMCHTEKVHFSLYPFHCSICKAGFPRAITLEKHMASEHSILDFKAPDGRRAHFKYHLTEDDVLHCNFCGQNFFYKTQLVEHIHLAHGSTFPFHCDRCKQGFLELQFLVVHQKHAHGIIPDPNKTEFDAEIAVNTPLVESDEMSPYDTVRRNDPEGNRMETNYLITDDTANSLPTHSEMSYIVRVENGESTIQYVIQHTEGSDTVSGESVVQDIASLLLAAEQSMQVETSRQGLVFEQHLFTNTSQEDVLLKQALQKDRAHNALH